MLNQILIDHILEIVTKASGKPATDVNIEEDVKNKQLVLTINTYNGLENANKAGKALMKHGMQHVAGDGKPEFVVRGAKGADLQIIRWPYDPEKELFKSVSKSSGKSGG